MNFSVCQPLRSSQSSEFHKPTPKRRRVARRRSKTAWEGGAIATKAQTMRPVQRTEASAYGRNSTNWRVAQADKKT